MKNDEHFAEAIRRIDAASAEDPRTDVAEGRPQARELLFARRVYEWVRKSVAEPTGELLLAARAHTLRRWMIPRDRYPMTTAGTRPRHECRGSDQLRESPWASPPDENRRTFSSVTSIST